MLNVLLRLRFRFNFIELVARRLKIKKLKQTIKHCTTKQYKTRQEMKCNAMQWKNNEPSTVALLAAEVLIKSPYANSRY